MKRHQIGKVSIINIMNNSNTILSKQASDITFSLQDIT